MSVVSIQYDNSIISTSESNIPVSIVYNGLNIANISDGVKTLCCNGKYMKSDVIIGEKILLCGGKIMKSDIVVSITGSSLEKLETPVIDINAYSLTVDPVPNAIGYDVYYDGTYLGYYDADDVWHNA